MTTNNLDYELITYNGQKARQYPDGSIRDSNGRFLVKHPASAPLITSENASDYHRAYAEKRARTIIQSANDAVENQSHKLNYGDMAFVAAIAQAQYIKATTPEDPKSTAAANFLLEQAGISAKQQNPGGMSQEDSYLRSFVADLAAIARAIPDKDEKV